MGLLDTGELRALVSRLCALRRESASGGERDAARLVADELARAGWGARIEREVVHGTFWWPLGTLSALAAVSTAAGRRLGALLATLASGALLDELWVGRRWFRRRLLPRRETVNVFAEQGAGRTLVLHAHHDAAHTGLVFRPLLFRVPASLLTGPAERPQTAPPMSWALVIAPLAAATGALARNRALARAGSAVCAIVAALMADVGRSAVVPGANDNASGVAALISIARALAADPAPRLRVVLLSTGSEESPLEGMEAWMRRHRFPPDTAFVCLDGVASERLVVADGEGMLKLHRYPDEPRTALLRCARELGVEVERLGFRVATDGQVALRSGYATAVLSSVEPDGTPRNYHLPSDDAEHVDYDTLLDATRVVLRLVRQLGR